MNFELPNLIPAIPEIFILVMACMILLVDLVAAKVKYASHIINTAYLFTQLTLVAAAVLTLTLFNQEAQVTFSGAFILDKLASVLKLAIYVASFFAFLYGRIYVAERNLPQGEYYVLGLFSILGAMVLVSAHNFLSLFLGLELLSLPLYAMVAIRRDVATATEAAMKYFVMGALASGMLLYGISLLYGATKSIDFNEVAMVISNTTADHNLIMIFGLVFLVVGAAFKLGSAPFHMWVPDVYHGAPTSATLLIGGAVKVAALGMALRILANALPQLHIQWQQLLIVIAILSMGLGNLVAIVQSNIKRMLAYSAIAHMGYMLLGLLSATPEGYAAAVFYMLAYAIMSVGAFGVIVLLSRAGIEAEHINDFKGLSAKHPWLAFMMLLIMFSMAGIPPTVGFFAKLGVLQALISVNLSWLAVLALLFAIIGAYYYIAIVKVMYFDEAPSQAIPVETAKDLQLAITINGLAILALGLFPSGLIEICRAAFL